MEEKTNSTTNLIAEKINNTTSSMKEKINSPKTMVKSNNSTETSALSGSSVSLSNQENNANASALSNNANASAQNNDSASTTTSTTTLAEKLNELISAAQRGDQTARMRVVGMHAGLVESVAKNYRGMGVDGQELIQAGMEGLLEAVNKFNPARGFQFARYAVWWIKMAMLNRISNHKR